ncbi:2-oxoglutarate dehydrogenase complex dihydrolipoyllysine-residue succinyltransferase [Salinispira pacifica]|uniref:Dihydrolipoyllysine-residue succinyltransferase component of 2-oxoglutarate dehydrogenase complex n=1 Tax=Salinispira pacifica TaxID=1307761 RepID=V5WKP8_9SPIO|nr:2-oxoglutarate dehydrogenase complex dihydrolipoyllysine-residue succinyltransferase [Salinispira pacifica]AHC16220.1 Dihydrolipoamide succinyltransferase component (E2) of 2-oxoglutarate dehydrogenase complex [Salinispira pacifica]
MIEIVVPNVGESVSSGIIAAWLKKDGDAVEEGDNLFELETDKATMEVPATASGVLHIDAREGDEVEVGAAVGRIDENASAPAQSSGDTARGNEESESKSQSGAKSGAKSGGKEKSGAKTAEDTAGSPTKEPAAAQKNTPEKQGTPEKSPAGRQQTGSGQQQGPAKKKRSLDDLSPAVRRLVEELDLDPSDIPGSGPEHRLLKEDVQRYVKQGAGSGGSGSRSPASGGAALHGDIDPDRQERVPMTNLRKRISERLVESKQTAAHLTTFNEVDMKAVMDIRKEYKESFEKKHGVRLGFMSFFLKAAVKALKEYPQVNAFVDGTDIIYNKFFDIGVALSSDRGLMTPVVRDCESKGFAEIETIILDFIQRAQKKKIMPDELMGGTFTISNGGVFGSMLSTPIPNPPQTAVLGMHTIQQRPVVRNGEIVIRPMMYLALTYDHRILDGREAIGFLKTIKEAVEDPNSLLLDV